MASSQDEFADALRNAHLSDSDEVYVAAQIMDAHGVAHSVKRYLTSDYAKRQSCQSRLIIDDAEAQESDLAALGIILSQPPLEAPVLAQHTLGYIFSVRPQDRATYFKSLLDVTDLEDLRSEIAALEDEIPPADAPLLDKYDAASRIPSLLGSFVLVDISVPDLEGLTGELADAARVLIEGTGEDAPATLNERVSTLESILTERRTKTFPVRGFQRDQLSGWNAPAQDAWNSLEKYLEEKTQVDKETRQLAALFEDVLAIRAVATTKDPLDCPLCGTEDALTPERLNYIRQHVESIGEYKTAEAAAAETLARLSASAESLDTSVNTALPAFMKTPPSARRETGFTVARLRELVAERSGELVIPWLRQVAKIARAARMLHRAARDALALAERHANDLETFVDLAELRARFEKLPSLRSHLGSALQDYGLPESALRSAINDTLDAQSDSAGWQAFIDVAHQPEALRTALIERQVRTKVGKELTTALKDIDRAKEKVLDDKFALHSDLIHEWWNRLRPDEATFFSALLPRPRARRTIDIKAGLSANPDQSDPKTRDVIAVFSQSQLHCLGLALFLARAQHDGTGFIVLDDPVLSSDENYRTHFNHTVLTELIGLPIQVIVLTQDHTTWQDLESYYRHLEISMAQLFTEDPAQGAIIDNRSDDLLAIINRSKSLARGGHPDTRKACGRQLRDAGELFCKEMLVADRRANGDASAKISDYDDRTLEWLCPRVEPLMVLDPSDPGKLEVFRNTVNPASHEDVPPSSGDLTHACGNLRRFVKDYLGR